MGTKIEFRGVGCLLSLFSFSVALFLLCVYTYALGERNALKTAKNSLKHEVLVVREECKCDSMRKTVWDDFIKALIWVESKDDSNAVGDKDDVGVLQIRRTIVDDCNRILGYDKYSYEDRRDSLKSVEMFNIIQDHYNPTRDKHFALKLWNSKAPIAYHRKVFKKLEENLAKDLQE